MGKMSLIKDENSAVYLLMLYKDSYFISVELNVSDIVCFLNGGKSHKFNEFDDIRENMKITALTKEELDFFKNFK